MPLPPCNSDYRSKFTDSKPVLDKMYGKTRVIVFDDYYRDKTPEDVQKILKHIAEIAYPNLLAQHMREVAAENAAKEKNEWFERF